MIVRETEKHFIMITQVDHAALSGDMASHFVPSVFGDDSCVEDVLYAIYEHDRSWLRLDDTPIWNDRAAAPYSFMDYPELPKLVLYRFGVDEIEQKNEYAALLCSRHFASFYPQAATMAKEYGEFVQYEQARQQRIINKLRLTSDSLVNRHFRLLQLCDSLSLYICLNEPGVSKEQEHPWYRNGINGSEKLFDPTDDRKLMAQWTDEETVQLSPFPFRTPFTAALRYKRIDKRSIRQLGLNEAYRQADLLEQKIAFAEAANP
ncbi:DUF3891 family protein [Paenibacillus sp. NPDC056579]|uniref:DUF3891 family protein n=1 Tax=Paenibacillus sp. NPDC056579 TaxID=3345871 RepID=UPI0036777CD8